MADEQKDLWSIVCERAGIEREPDDVGYPTQIPMTYSFEWFNFRRDLVKFEVGEVSPLKATHKIVAIFEEDFVVRVYGAPEKKSEKPEDNFPIRWTVQTTAPTQSLTRFLDTNTLFDALAAELILADSEFEEVSDGKESPPPLPVTGGSTPEV